MIYCRRVQRVCITTSLSVHQQQVDKDASRFGLQRGTQRQVTYWKVTDGLQTLFISVTLFIFCLIGTLYAYCPVCIFNASLDMSVMVLRFLYMKENIREDIDDSVGGVCNDDNDGNK